MATDKPKNTTTFIVKSGKKKLECVIKEPDFQAISFGLTALTSPSGNLAMADGGKAIFDTCKVSCDKEIEQSGRMTASICIKIAEEFLIPVEVDIKKN